MRSRPLRRVSNQRQYPFDPFSNLVFSLNPVPKCGIEIACHVLLAGNSVLRQQPSGFAVRKVRGARRRDPVKDGGTTPSNPCTPILRPPRFRVPHGTRESK
jgi:hypothetical protein